MSQNADQRNDKPSSPHPHDVISLRERYQKHHGLNITQSQKACAQMLFTTLRVWQHWERGERSMHPAFWELINIKVIEPVSHLD